MKSIISVVYFMLSVLTAMIGYTIHGGWFFTFMDLVFWPLAIMKWFIFHQINLTILKTTFGFFLQ